jgi:putative peptide zinc metalloprotease protein
MGLTMPQLFALGRRVSAAPEPVLRAAAKLGPDHPSALSTAQLRRRRDLRYQQLDNARWNVLDPISRQNYRVGLIEHWLLTRPDGRQSIPQLLSKLRAEYSDLTWSDEQLLAVLATFRRNGLLTSHGSEPTVVPTTGVWQAWLGSMVVWQIRGLQPDRWLTRLLPYTSGLFSGLAVRCWLLLASLTGLLIMLDFRRLATQSLSLEWILHPTTSGLLLVVFVLTRAFHELGHALVCKRFGIRCPDIGLFVILGAPCVYCDVSESWQLAHRWQRAAVAAAGMYVELIVATLAAWLWLATVPGPANTLALQTMLVCSLSTVIINANPLMRFDGYYILTDWLDEVNLRAKADSIAGAALRRALLGKHLGEPSKPLSGSYFLLAFSLAGWIYRGLLSITIATVLVSMYAGWNLPWIGRFLAIAILVSWWGIPVMKLAQDLVRIAWQQQRQWRLAAVATLLVLAVMVAPIPSRPMGRGWLQPTESRGVYAASSARLQGCAVRDGEPVQVGEPLFRLHSRELTMRLVRFQHAQELAGIRLESSRRQRDMHRIDVDVEHYANEREETETWLNNALREQESLTITAPVAGRLVAMPAPAPRESDEAALTHSTFDSTNPQNTAATSATWCAPQQLGRLIPAGTHLASVCGEQNTAVIPLSEAQLSQVASGTAVRLRIAAQKLVLKDCTVKSVVHLEQLASPWQAAAMAELMTTQSPQTNLNGSRFAAVIELPTDIRDLPGTSVDAVFVSPTTTLAGIAIRWMQANLRLFND